MPKGVYKRRFSKFKDLSGKKINMLFVLERVSEIGDPRGAVWRCTCDCGRLKEIRAVCLVTGRQKSCGCLRKEGRTKYNSTRYAAYRDIESTYKCGARKRNLSWEIDQSVFDKLISSPCYYCGNPGSNFKRKRGEIVRYNGIDRRNNYIGYTEENCVSSCKKCNFCKVKLGATEFIDHCIRVVATFKAHEIAKDMSIELYSAWDKGLEVVS